MMKINVNTCSYRLSDHSVFTLYKNFFNHVGEHKTTKYEETNDCGSIAITASPATKTHSSYSVKLQKEVKSVQKSQAVKEGAVHAKRQHEIS